MRYAPALPINQLMPAASSRNTPAATPARVDRPGKKERPHPVGSPHAGHPSIIMSPDHRPWTQIWLGAGTRRVSRTRSLTGGNK